MDIQSAQTRLTGKALVALLHNNESNRLYAPTMVEATEQFL
jgi:hypothetical protein